MTAVFPTIIWTNNVRPHFQVTVPTDVNVVRLSIDGGKTWFNATQSATPGAWDYIWPDDVPTEAIP